MTFPRFRRISRFVATLVAATVAALLPPPFARAGPAVHKCADPSGAIVYQDRPCGPQSLSAWPSGAEGALSVVPGTRLPSIVREPRPPPPPRTERVRKTEAAKPGNPADRRHLRTGMSEGEVVARIGPPDLTTGKGRRQSRWTWMPVAADPDTITTVLFDTGRAIEIERTVVKR